jgi:hypothetical protein
LVFVAGQGAEDEKVVMRYIYFYLFLNIFWSGFVSKLSVIFLFDVSIKKVHIARHSLI